MENFGTRLSVDEIWKVVLFLKTIANGGLTAEVPTPDMYVQWKGYSGIFQWAQCFYPDEMHFANDNPYNSAPPGIGDVPGIVGEGKVNPVYAVVLWEVNNNARPCGTPGHEKVTLQDILTEAEKRTDGYARQGTDQVQFIPASMIDVTQMPPQWLDQVWDKPNPYIEAPAGNR
jgi:hypothetical protein